MRRACACFKSKLTCLKYRSSASKLVTVKSGSRSDLKSATKSNKGKSVSCTITLSHTTSIAEGGGGRGGEGEEREGEGEREGEAERAKGEAIGFVGRWGWAMLPREVEDVLVAEEEEEEDGMEEEAGEEG